MIYWALTVITEILIRLIEKRINRFRVAQHLVETPAPTETPIVGAQVLASKEVRS